MARNLRPWQSQPESEGLTWWVGNIFLGEEGGGNNLIHTVNFSVKVRAGKWEEAIAELNSATRFLESGTYPDLFLCHQ